MFRQNYIFWLSVLFASLGWCVAPLAYAQPKAKETKVESAPPSLSPSVPDDYKLVSLIKTTIIAVSQANMTGNYSLLRDLGTPAFQTANNPSKLSDIFSSLRFRKLDLSPVIFFQPKLIGKPQILENGALRLTGFLPTAPEQVNFDLTFQMFDGRWMLDGIAIGMSQTPTNEALAQSKNAPTKGK